MGHVEGSSLCRVAGTPLDRPSAFCRTKPVGLPHPNGLAAPVITDQVTTAARKRSQERLRDVLNSGGRRLTTQRQKVLSLFQRLGHGHHLTAEEVHQQLKQSGNKVSLATVYRSLKLLVAMGLLEEGEWQEGLRRYELRQQGEGAEHHHMVCMRCGNTEEFTSDSILSASQTIARNAHFQLVEVRLTLHGLCRRCRQRMATAEASKPPLLVKELTSASHLQ